MESFPISVCFNASYSIGKFAIQIRVVDL